MSDNNQDRASEQAKAQLQSIVEMVEALNDSDDDARETAIEAIYGDPLSVTVRDGWRTLGDESETEEYQILLCTGGPAVRIYGELGACNEPVTAILQYQDWFTPWENYNDTTDEEDEALRAYAQCFCFEV